MHTPSDHYWPFYCEENAWWLARTRADRDGFVMFISNAARQVLMLHQRAGEGDQQLVVWDYHVVWLEPGETGWRVFDPDHAVDEAPGGGVAAEIYLQVSFPSLGSNYQELAPSFRLIEGQAFLADFASDRSHMQVVSGDGSAEWLQPPPPWPAPGRGHNLDQYISIDADGPGRVLSLPALLELIGAPRA